MIKQSTYTKVYLANVDVINLADEYKCINKPCEAAAVLGRGVARWQAELREVAFI